MAGAGGLLPGAAGEKWEEKLWLVERLVKRLGGGGVSWRNWGGSLQEMLVTSAGNAEGKE